MLKKLEVTLTRDRHNKPLVVVESAIGNGMEVSPDRLRALAAALVKAADDADAKPTTPRHFAPIKREYAL